jgi:rhamnosyltransferase
MPSAPLVTVAVLTYNGERYLDRILTAVLAQRVDGEVDVLVIDSGSTDSTLSIVARHPQVRLHQIPNTEFGHGKTRNLAAQLARGTYVAFLTHDAIPTDERWLSNLLEPFALNKSIVAVTGKQVPRTDCFPVQKYEITGLFQQLGSAAGLTLYRDDPFVAPRVAHLISFYSDVNAASPRDFLLRTIPYRDVPYAEDQLFGKDVIDAGFTKAYAARAAVEHSNDLTRREYGRRIFDETVGLRRIGFDIPTVSSSRAILRAVVGAIFDGYRILRDGEYSRGRKVYWWFVNPRYQVTKWRSLRNSTRVRLDDQAALEAGSLEHSRKTAG